MSAAIHQEVTFKARPHQVYTALTDAAHVQQDDGGRPG
jgi:uncharacterized protein YndB with AHSA1/START domain